MQHGYPVIYVEANPRLAYCLKEGYDDDNFFSNWPNIPPWPHKYIGLKEYKNLRIINAAIAPRPGMVKVYERNASSFVGGTESPAKHTDKYIEDEKDAYYVPAITIDEIDNGEIDVLLADVEGSEWFCINGLTSRPKLIVLETHGANYVNPYINEIAAWMNQNGYHAADQDASDTYFVRTEAEQ